MQKLPEIKPKIKTLKLGGYDLEFRQATIGYYNLILDIDNTAKEEGDEAAVEPILNLLTALLHVDNTHEEKRAFLDSIDIQDIGEVSNLYAELISFSGVDVEAEGQEDKKK